MDTQKSIEVMLEARTVLEQRRVEIVKQVGALKNELHAICEALGKSSQQLATNDPTVSAQGLTQFILKRLAEKGPATTLELRKEFYKDFLAFTSPQRRSAYNRVSVTITQLRKNGKVERIVRDDKSVWKIV